VALLPVVVQLQLVVAGTEETVRIIRYKQTTKTINLLLLVEEVSRCQVPLVHRAAPHSTPAARWLSTSLLVTIAIIDHHHTIIVLQPRIIIINIYNIYTIYKGDATPAAAGGAGGAGAGGPFGFLRQHPQFDALRLMVQSNPAMLQPVLQQLGQQNPQVSIFVSLSLFFCLSIEVDAHFVVVDFAADSTESTRVYSIVERTGERRGAGSRRAADGGRRFGRR
jgi:hypothetical protein